MSHPSTKSANSKASSLGSSPPPQLRWIKTQTYNTESEYERLGQQHEMIKKAIVIPGSNLSILRANASRTGHEWAADQGSSASSLKAQGLCKTDNSQVPWNPGRKLSLTDQKSAPLRILDSACYDGTWILDVLPTLPPSTLFVGTDIDTTHFSRIPEAADHPRIRFQYQDVREDWPADMLSNYDLVHQRFVLGVVGPKAPDVVGKLLKLVKPGSGWVQLVDGTATPLFAERVPGLGEEEQPSLVLKAAIECQGHISHAVPELLPRWLEGAGAVDVVSEQYVWKVGGKTKEGQWGLQNFLAMLTIFEGLMEGRDDSPVSPEYWDRARKAVAAHFKRAAAIWPFKVAYGRRPGPED